MAGLLAARALADSYERVTVVDRDTLPAGCAGRRAVPQGRHVHSLMPRGQDCIEALLPGFGAEIVAAGAPTYRAMEDLRFELGGRRLARASLGLNGIVAGRPLIEGHVRRRVREHQNVSPARRLRRARARRGRRPRGRRADPPARGRQQRRDAGGRPGRVRDRARRARAGVAGGARLPAARRGAAPGGHRVREPVPAARPRRARRRQARADRTAARPAARAVPVRPGGRSVHPHGRRLRA